MSTINDVARLAQVSKATVSRVLSGSRGVREDSRQAVLRAAEKLNYRPNVIAQSLNSQMTHCIGVICASEHVQQATGYLQALEKQLRQQHKHLLLRFAHDANSLLTALNELSSGLCDGLIIAGARFTLPAIPEDVVLMDCLDSTSERGVYCDHDFAAQTAVNYLACHQRRHIALINYPQGDTANQTLEGYRQALNNQVIPFNRQLVIHGRPDFQDALLRLINSRVRFNGLLVTDEYQARQAMSLLARYHLNVPEHVMIFSLDSSGRMPDGPADVPAIHYPLESMARQAIDWLLGDAPQGEPVRGSLIGA